MDTGGHIINGIDDATFFDSDGEQWYASAQQHVVHLDHVWKAEERDVSWDEFNARYVTESEWLKRQDL